MVLSMMVAASDNEVIARNGQIPWFVRGEQAIFKRVTMGHPIIMGRKTFESLPKVLPGRLNIVITRNRDYPESKGMKVVHSLDEALNLPAVKASDEPIIIGGQEIFSQAMPLAGRLYFTRVHTSVDGDKHFRFDRAGWVKKSSELYKKNEVPDRPYSFEFQVWERVK